MGEGPVPADGVQSTYLWRAGRWGVPRLRSCRPPPRRASLPSSEDGDKTDDEVGVVGTSGVVMWEGEGDAGQNIMFYLPTRTRVWGPVKGKGGRETLTERVLTGVWVRKRRDSKR